MSNLTRRDVTKGVVAMTAAAILPTTPAQAGQHRFHTFLDDMGIDSATAPSDLSVEFTDVNHSSVLVESGNLSKTFDLRSRLNGGQEAVKAKIRTALINNFGAQPKPQLGASGC